MDFDHRDPETKHKGIAQMVAYGWSLERLAAEIAKCELVCANCHRLRTAKRAGWRRHAEIDYGEAFEGEVPIDSVS
jgi:hypothetical protein